MPCCRPGIRRQWLLGHDCSGIVAHRHLVGLEQRPSRPLPDEKPCAAGGIRVLFVVVEAAVLEAGAEGLAGHIHSRQSRERLICAALHL